MRSPDTCRCGPEEFDVSAIEVRRDLLSGKTCHDMSERVTEEFLRRRRVFKGWNRMYIAFSICIPIRAQTDQELEDTMPMAPPAVMVEPPSVARPSSTADPASDSDSIQRKVNLGLPVGSSASNAPSSSRKETYMWGGYRKYISPLRICHLNSALMV